MTDNKRVKTHRCERRSIEYVINPISEKFHKTCKMASAHGVWKR